MRLFDRFLKVLSDHSIDVKLNWRQDGIALAGKRNFARITPRKSGHCLLRFSKYFGEDALAAARERLEEAGVAVQALSKSRFSVRLDDQVLERSTPVLVELVRRGIEIEG